MLIVAGRFTQLSKVLSIILGAMLICAIGGVIYLAVVPPAGEKFTEFYVLGPEGKADDYPEKVALGEEAMVIVGIVNREYRETSYRVEITIDGRNYSEIGPVVLAHDETWEQEVSLRPEKAEEQQKVEFLLYKGKESANASERLHIWVDVME